MPELCDTVNLERGISNSIYFTPDFGKLRDFWRIPVFGNYVFGFNKFAVAGTNGIAKRFCTSDTVSCKGAANICGLAA